MKRPEKKETAMFDYDGPPATHHDIAFREGYNKACDDWEKFLPGEGEIKDILEKIDYEGLYVEEVAKAIHERLNK